MRQLYVPIRQVSPPVLSRCDQRFLNEYLTQLQQSLLSTGTLTANKMTVRALYTALKNMVAEDPKVTLGDFVKGPQCVV